MDESNEKNVLDKKRILIVIILIVILLIIYSFYRNRVIGSRWGAEGEYIKIGDTSYVENNVHKHSSMEKSKYLGVVVYKYGTKSKVYRIKNCEYCILAYDGTPKILMKEQ